jgi:hypothetical protein
MLILLSPALQADSQPRVIKINGGDTDHRHRTSR